MNVRHLHSQQHGYVPPGPLYFDHDAAGQPAPPGYVFNVNGELVPLPYQPWDDGPHFQWEDLQNPFYVEYAQGRSSIEAQPTPDGRLPARYGKHAKVGHVAPETHETVALVPQSAYLDRDGDVVPQQDEGTGSQAVFDMPASFARTRYRLSKDVMGYAEVEAPLLGSNSPLLVVPTGSAEGAPAVAPFGGAVAIVTFQFGHLGSQIANITTDVLPGSLVKSPTASSFMRVTGRIAPRYYAHTDAGALPNILRTYLLFPGGPALTSDSFTDLPPNIMELQGNGAGTIVAANAQQNPVQFFGWCAQGYVSTPSIDSLPSRVFRGTVPNSAPAAPFTNRSRVPIPRGAVGVRVIGGFNDQAAATQAAPVEWVQNLDWGGATTGPFPANAPQPIPIVQGAVSIDVLGGSTAAASGTIEIPFAVYFYLNL